MNILQEIMNYKKVKSTISFESARGHFRGFLAPISIIVSSRKKMKAFEDKYRGKRCFIIGNGPSLKAEDLDMIKGEICFAANKIYKLYDKTSWRPTFYCVQDLRVGNEMGNEQLVAIDSSYITFMRMSGYSQSKNMYQKNKNKYIYIPICQQPSYISDVGFSEHADKFVYDGATVTYMSMQIAAYMGFSEIYLLGVDHSFPFKREENGEYVVVDINQAAHFYETSNDNKTGSTSYIGKSNAHYFVTKAYEAAEKYSKSSGKFRIYNATRGGKLEIFERVNLEDVIKQNGRK